MLVGGSDHVGRRFYLVVLNPRLIPGDEIVCTLVELSSQTIHCVMISNDTVLQDVLVRFGLPVDYTDLCSQLHPYPEGWG